MVNHKNTCSKFDFDAKRTRARRAVHSNKNHHSNIPEQASQNVYLLLDLSSSDTKPESDFNLLFCLFVCLFFWGEGVGTKITSFPGPFGWAKKEGKGSGNEVESKGNGIF